MRRLRYRTGSPPGRLNRLDRIIAAVQAFVLSIVAAVSTTLTLAAEQVKEVLPTTLTLAAEQVKEVLPTIRQSSPIWVGVTVGTVVAVISYAAQANVQKQSDNREKP